LKEVYAKANGITDFDQVTPADIVRLFAHSVTVEEFSQMIGHGRNQPKKKVLPQQAPLLNRKTYLNSVPPTPIQMMNYGHHPHPLPPLRSAPLMVCISMKVFCTLCLFYEI
jgi:hypothetical protein